MGKKKTEAKTSTRIVLNIDINAAVMGFESAKTPTKAHRKIMKNYSSVLILGPPPGDDLLELTTHMFTDEEAMVAQHLPALWPRTAAQAARRCGMSASRATSILDHLADNKHVIFAFGTPRKYTILPLVPGTFELAVMSPDLTRTNAWHKRFAELFEKIWDSSYMKDYVVDAPLVRYLPVPGSLSTLQSAWPTDMLEEILEPYDTFGIAHCQCRLVTELAGRGCGKPTENCVGIGTMAQPLIDRGLMRPADKEEVIEAKRNAEKHGCVTWMMNSKDSSQGNISCSCCGCCCHGLRIINDFSAPGLISKPHFMPHRDETMCNDCGKCARICPMNAWQEVAAAGEKSRGAKYQFDSERCIGCGLCVSNCKPGALELMPVPDAGQPEKNYNMLLLKNTPAFLSNAFKIWLRRTVGV